MTVCAHCAFSQRATKPPSAAVRQAWIALITFNCAWLTCPRLASSQAEPKSRKMSATSREMGSAGLESLAVLHHRLDPIRRDRARKALARRLLARYDRNAHVVLDKPPVDTEHGQRFLYCLRLGRVGGVAFLPEEFGGAQEQPRPQLPAHDVRPLVELQR